MNDDYQIGDEDNEFYKCYMISNAFENIVKKRAFDELKKAAEDSYEDPTVKKDVR